MWAAVWLLAMLPQESEDPTTGRRVIVDEPRSEFLPRAGAIERITGPRDSREAFGPRNEAIEDLRHTSVPMRDRSDLDRRTPERRELSFPPDRPVTERSELIGPRSSMSPRVGRTARD